MTQHANLAAFTLMLMLGGCQYKGSYDFSNLLNEGERIVISKESIGVAPDLETVPQKKIIRAGSIEKSELKLRTSDGRFVQLGEGRLFPTGGDRYGVSENLVGGTLTNVTANEVESGYINPGSFPDHKFEEMTEENGWKSHIERVGNNSTLQLHVEFLSKEEDGILFLRSGGIKQDQRFYEYLFYDRRVDGIFDSPDYFYGMPTGEFSYGDESITVFWEANGEFWSLEGSVDATVNFDSRLVDVAIESPSIIARAEDMVLKDTGRFGTEYASILRYENSKWVQILPEISQTGRTGLLGGLLHGAGEGMTGGFKTASVRVDRIVAGEFAAERNDQ